MSTPPSSDNPTDLSQDPRHFPGRRPPERSEPAPDADFDEQIKSFLEKNGKQLALLIAVAFVVIVGVQLSRVLSARQESTVQETFAGLTTIEGWKTFADQYSSHSLAGVALLEAAHAEYAAEDFAAAAQTYRNALESLELPQLQERARLGEAMALLFSDNPSAGKDALQALQNDLIVSGYTRGEAAYTLAVEYYQEGNIPATRDTLDRLIATPEAGVWQQLGDALYDELPSATAE